MCKNPQCGNQDIFAKGWCERCYFRVRNHGDPNHVERRHTSEMPTIWDVHAELAIYVEEHGKAPTHEELSKRLGIARQSVWERVVKLEQLGWVERTDAPQRNVRILKGAL